jgi:hypothetical protein
VKQYFYARLILYGYAISAMPVPNSAIAILHRLLRTLLVFLIVVPSVSVFAKGTDQPLRIPLENLGFQRVSSQFLLNGSSMLTVHFVDEQHLLITFVVHKLIPRLPDEPEDDQDRVVDAILLELPTGKILARTSWHLHDHAQYLWDLGHGHFLLRVRDTLTTFAPLANLATRDPFAQQPFLVSAERRIAALIVSPESDLLIIQSVKRKPPTKHSQNPLFGPTPKPTPHLEDGDPVQINFYRIRAGDDGGRVEGRSAGVVQAKRTGDVPVTTAGFLAVVDQGKQHWAFDFHSFAGKIDELSPFDSTCTPAPLFVSHSEFIAFGCRGGQSRHQLGGFNMRGEEMWEQGLFGEFVSPTIAYAPRGGRFALGRVMLRTSAVADQPISSDEVSSQTVVVYQTGTGKQLFRVDCSPVERAGQNFALSPSGLALAVFHADALEIYTLPALTPKDQTDIKLAQTSAPAENNLPVHFINRPAPESSGDEASSEPATKPDNAATATTSAPPPAAQPAPAPQPAPTAPPSATPTAPGAEAQPALFSNPANLSPGDPGSGDRAPGDPGSEQHRPPPTLYNLPGEKAPSAPPANPKETPQ